MSKLEDEAAFIFGSMRDSTQEERENVNDYIESISEPTGVNFNELLKPYEHKVDGESADELLESARKEREEKIYNYTKVKFNWNKIFKVLKSLWQCLLLFLIGVMIKDLLITNDITAKLIGIFLTVLIIADCVVNIYRDVKLS